MPQVSIGRPVSAIGVETTTRFSLINGWRWRPNRESRTRYRRRRFRGRCWIMAAMNICAPTTASQLASSYRRVANGTHLPSIFGCFFFRPLLFLASFLSLFLPCFCPPLFSFFFHRNSLEIWFYSEPMIRFVYWWVSLNPSARTVLFFLSRPECHSRSPSSIESLILI